ncbi:hypothetical protein B9Z39_08290 [Limnohabitans sp. JirII-29]|nr:hypothetical protein B9Z39_08290 [Limnohabitans sp. JirII-29]
MSGKAVQAATFARGAYDNKTPFVAPAGFEPLDVKLVNPQSPDFAASAYVNPKTGELVVAYRGSDSTTDLTTALKAAANGTWNGQFTDAAAYMKQAQGAAAKAVKDYSDSEDINLSDRPAITTLATGHSLGGMLAQVVAKMYGVDAQVQDAPGAARLIDTPQFKQIALENGQPESGHDITGKIQNVTTSNIAKLGEQFQETQVVPIPALGQMGGVDALATLGTFLANPLAGLATGEALQTVAEHSSAKIEDALYMLAGVKGQIADAGALTLQTMFLDRDGKPVSYAPISSGDSSSSTWQIQALVDKSGKAIAFFDREVVDGEMQPVAVVVQSGNRIHLAHAQDASSPQVIETTVSGERRLLSQSELLTSLQDPRGTPEVNIYSADSVNGMDLQSDQVHKAQENIQQSESDASGTLPDTPAPTNANTNTFTHYLDTQGSTLSTAQQDALAAQINKLGLGTDKALSFYTLPGGGALIATADGDIVGEINRSSTGDLSLKATAIDASGNTVEVNQHINEQGSVLTQDQYNTQAQQQASALFNSLMAANNWDHLSDVGKLSALVNLYNATDKLGEAFGATGNNLPGDLDAAAGWLSLAQGLQSGDSLIIANGINVVSDRALDNAMNEAFGNTAAGESVPYLSYALAIRNFEDNPEVAAGTMLGTYIGEDIGAVMGGPIGAAIGGAIGGMIGGALGGLFGGDDIPMRQGLAHAQWDAQGQTQIITTQDAEGGGSTANSWMSSLVDGLQTQLQSYNSQHNASDGLGLALIPNLLPSVGFKYDPDGYNLANGARGFMYLQWIDEQGQTQTRFYDGAGNRGDDSGETLSGDFVQHAQSAIAPAWQVQTVLAHYQQALQQEQTEVPLHSGAGGAYEQQANAQASNDDCMRATA